MSAVQCKLIHGEDKRRFSLAKPTYEDLRQAIAQCIPTSKKFAVQIRYEDEERDHISLSSTRELLEAIEIMHEQKRPILRLHLSVTDVEEELPIAKEEPKVVAPVVKEELPIAKEEPKLVVAPVVEKELGKQEEVLAPLVEPPAADPLSLLASRSGVSIDRLIAAFKPEALKEDPGLISDLMAAMGSKDVACPVPPVALSLSDRSEEVQQLEATFVRDLSVEDGQKMAPGAQFAKIWRLCNTGKVSWPAGVRLQFIGGENFGHVASVLISKPLAAGQNLDIKVGMIAPTDAGRYVSYWRLHTPSGERFGQRIWCDIIIEKASPVAPVAVPIVAPVKPVDVPAKPASPPVEPALTMAEQIAARQKKQVTEALNKLASMGFTDAERNKTLLIKHGGELPLVIQELLG